MSWRATGRVCVSKIEQLFGGENMASIPLSVQNALNFQLKIKPGHVNDVAQLVYKSQAKINEGINRIGAVHFLRFLFLPWPLTEKSDTLFVITSYDGDFDTYIAQFTYH